MKKIRKIVLLVSILFLLLPSVLVCIFEKNGKILISKKGQLEKYLPAAMYKTIDDQMHIETLKAQAVILRSNMARALQEGKITYKELGEVYSLLQQKWTEEDKVFYKRLVKACGDTEGQVAVYDNKICYCPYFYTSCGVTRDAFAFFQDDSYPYIVSVPSHRDEECTSYITYHHFSQQEFAEKANLLCEDTYDGTVQIQETDSAGYVMWIKIGEKSVGGEIFREKLQLSSSCFSIEQMEDGIRIVCKGRGHGFGFSQYGANAMAVEQKDYQELLNYYFHNITIENMYTFL